MRWLAALNFAVLILSAVFILKDLLGFPVSLPGQTWCAFQSKSWPTVEGRVYQVSVRELPHFRQSPEWLPDITFEYTVRSATYRSNRIAWGSAAAIEPSFPEVREYQVGQTVTAYYNPSNHAQSVLKPGMSSWLMDDWLLFIGSVVAFFVCLNLHKPYRRR